MLVLAGMALGYLLGSIPFGLLLARAGGAGDIRKIGSGNIGATNVLRTGNKGLAALTLLLDGAKGWLAPVLVDRFDGSAIGPALAAAIGALLGHCFPVWLGFKGGKGVATFFGTFLVIHWEIGVISGATWIVTAAISRISSLAALTAVALTPVYIMALSQPRAFLIAALFMGVLIYYRHLPNIDRLLKGQEPRIGGKSSAKPDAAPQA